MKLKVNTAYGVRERRVYSIDDFPYHFFQFPSVTYHHRHNYVDYFGAFDIETTTVSADTAFMYHWQCCFYPVADLTKISEKEIFVVFGRRWEELYKLFKRLKEIMRLSSGKRFVFYVHNLSYEFQFLTGLFKMTEVFAREKRKVMRFLLDDCFEFRCSYYLSNMTLEKFCENTEGVVHRKAKGDLDYSVIRTCDTPLTETELGYCYNDVRGLAECIAKRLEEDDLAMIPMTSTGYVRRDYREALARNKKNWELFQLCSCTPELYRLMQDEFRGGDTHGEAMYTGEIIEDVHSFDLKSSYPFQLLARRYPMTRFTKVDVRTWNETYYRNPDYASLITIAFTSIRKKEMHGNPYIPTYKCHNKRNVLADNGRVLKADYIELTLTDIDLEIIEHDYEWEGSQIGVCYVSKYGYLPTEFRQHLLKMFESKCRLDGDEEHYYEYQKSKNAINSSYGMMVTDIAPDNVLYQDGNWGKVSPDLEEAIQKYYKSRKNFLPYQWGVWVTCHARRQYREPIWELGDAWLYGDTDSNKFIGEENISIFERLNKETLFLIDGLDIKPQVTVNDKTFTMGLWEREKDIDRFVYLGAKKYACFYKDRKTGKRICKTTVAGLSKEVGGEFFTKTGLKLFREGTRVSKPGGGSGRNTAYYIDRKEPEYITVCDVGGRESTFLTGGAIALVEQDYYELGITDEYRGIVDAIKNGCLH